ncbi:restriction endonuclease [Vibrio vulnificus]|uniref:restriction endonuclease n=1 Tax=Vibrio vulnificus TaxID=672 RepID=UPI0005F1BC06|nr:restriction endonuclease [Vibrio vulnificus]
MTPKEYEDLVSRLLKNELPIDTEIEQLKVFQGKDTSHVIDISYNLKIAGVNYLNVVECKLWSRKVGKREMQAFHSTIKDIGANKGIFVTSIGFQSGAIEIAKKNGIALVKVTNEHPLFDVQHNFRGGLIEKIKSLRTRKQVTFSKPVYLTGMVDSGMRIKDYLLSNYGQECADFLCSEEIRWLKDLSDSNEKSLIMSQIERIPEDWQRDFWNVETGGLRCTVVEPETKIRIINLRILEEKRNLS